MSDVLFMVNCMGIGDTLAATPVIEYFCDKIGDGKRVDVWSHHPELFRTSPFVDRVFTGNKQPNEDFFLQWHPQNVHITYPLVTTPPLRGSHSHLVDFQSAAAYNCILPAEAKNYRVHIPDDKGTEIAGKYRLGSRERWIALHPGFTWKTRSLKQKVWQEILDGLLERDPELGIILIGRNKDLKQRGAKGLNTRGAPRVLDLIDETSLIDTLCVLKQCWGIVCTDSGAICMAGVSDAHLFAVLSLHPAEYRAPYRNGSPLYKTHVINNDVGCLYCGMGFMREDKNLANCINYEDEMACMPTAEQVIERILSV